ncbi:hypothetical protein PybrP1_001733, partial [[Pythium] brassicae (nom. inval.)]
DTGTHAARGGAVTLAALTLLANAVRNRGALAHLLLLRWRQALAALEAVPPSRNVAAVAVFVASRAALVSLASTSAASLLFRQHLARHPELAHLAPIELLVFMASGGWIVYSTLFHRESYDPTHIQFIMKSTLLSPAAVTIIQEQYEQGLNPSICTLRHPGIECSEHLSSDFLQRIVVSGYRMYLPVHAAAWLLSLRHAKVRATPLPEMFAKLVVRLTRSALYYIGFIGLGWTTSCYTSALGARSLAWRKVQFALCGSLPALSILFEQPSRRRPIGVVLVSYALVSAKVLRGRTVLRRALLGKQQPPQLPQQQEEVVSSGEQ